MKEKYIDIALKEAKKAYRNDEVPVGAIIIKDGEIIAKAHNKKINTNNIFAHAEMLAIEKASKKIGDWRLNDCVMYVTLETCPMCASAIQQSRIKQIYIGTTSNIKSNKNVMMSIFDNDEYYHKVNVQYLNNKECSNILTDFFVTKRQK